MQSVIDNTWQFCIFNEINLIQILYLIASHFQIGIHVFKIWLKPFIYEFLIKVFIKIFDLQIIIILKINLKCWIWFLVLLSARAGVDFDQIIELSVIMMPQRCLLWKCKGTCLQITNVFKSASLIQTHIIFDVFYRKKIKII